jgi:hypothetical protein
MKYGTQNNIIKSLSAIDTIVSVLKRCKPAIFDLLYKVNELNICPKINSEIICHSINVSEEIKPYNRILVMKIIDKSILVIIILLKLLSSRC